MTRAYAVAIEKAGEEVKIVCPHDIRFDVAGGRIALTTVDGQPFTPSLVYLRMKPGPGCELIYLLEEAGIRTVNSPRAWRISNDKTLQAVAFARHGVPHPWSLFAGSGTPESLPLPPPRGAGWVLKPAHGSKGVGVRVVEGEMEAGGEWQFRRRRGPTPDDRSLLQELISPPGGVRCHVRCDVVGGRAVGAGSLVAGEGMFVSNQAQGGQWTEWPEVPREIGGLAVAATRAVGADQAGVDLIQDEYGDWLVLECNDMADFGATTFRALVAYLIRQVRWMR